MHRITKASDVPDKTHFCLLVYKKVRVYQDGDYSEDIDTVEHYVSFDEFEMKKQIGKRLVEKVNFVFFKVPALGKAIMSIEVSLWRARIYLSTEIPPDSTRFLTET